MVREYNTDRKVRNLVVSDQAIEQMNRLGNSRVYRGILRELQTIERLSIDNFLEKSRRIDDMYIYRFSNVKLMFKIFPNNMLALVAIKSDNRRY